MKVQEQHMTQVPLLPGDDHSALLTLQLLAASLGPQACSQDDSLRKELNRLARVPAPKKADVARIKDHIRTLVSGQAISTTSASQCPKPNWLFDGKRLQAQGLFLHWEKSTGRLHALYRQILLLAQYQSAQSTDCAHRQAPLLLCSLSDRRQEEAAMNAMQNPAGMLVVSFAPNAAARQRFHRHASRNIGVLVELPQHFSPNLTNHKPLLQNLPLYLEPCAGGILTIGLRPRSTPCGIKKPSDRSIPALFRAMARCRISPSEPANTKTPL